MAIRHDMRAGYGITHTLDETAQLMGLTRERVRQIEKQAFAKIRRLLKERYGITNVAGFLGQTHEATRWQEIEVYEISLQRYASPAVNI